MTVSDSLSGWVWCELLVYSFVMSQSFMVDETPREFLLENLSLGREGEFRESLSMHLLSFKCLQLKTVHTPKPHLLG